MEGLAKIGQLSERKDDDGREFPATLTPEEIKAAKPNITLDEPTLKAFLGEAELQFPVLKELFAVHLRKSGLQQQNFIAPTSTFYEQVTNGVLGYYYAEGNYITLTNNIGLYREAPKAADYEDEDELAEAAAAWQLEPLLTLIHEQWHAEAAMHTVKKSIQENTLVKSETIEGFRKTIASRFGSTSFEQGTNLDEGFVEYISRKTLLEYVRRVGTYRGVNVELAAHSLWDINLYERESEIVELLIDILSHLLESPSEEIEGAFLRSYLTGQHIFSEEIQKLLVAADAAELWDLLEDLMENKNDKELPRSLEMILFKLWDFKNSLPERS